LAAELGLSRTTVLSAYDQLTSEGYIEPHVGRGTEVAAKLPEAFTRAVAENGGGGSDERGRRPPSRRARAAIKAKSAVPYPGTSSAFRVGIPPIDAFPLQVWSKLLYRRTRYSLPSFSQYGNFAGYEPLREAVAAYLAVSRGVHCSPGQVLITHGAQGAIDLAARVLADPGDEVWVEDPGYLGAHGAFAAAGLKVVGVPVDGMGLRVSEGKAKAPEARFAFISPSHQFPLAVTLTLERRAELLEWVTENDAWIIEDDYDSEYRYASRPLPALQGQDHAGRVIYIGTFTKVLYPGLRLGYIVVPETLVDVFLATRRFTDIQPPTLEQLVLTDFITEGHFERHIRRLRVIGRERAEALASAIQAKAGPWLRVDQPAGGLHTVAWLRDVIDPDEAQRRAASVDVDVRPLSLYALTHDAPPGLVLGFGNVNAWEIDRGVERLARVLSALSVSSAKRFPRD
jgi:GntR family transcriptional regulator/MocR family aminotransferase